MATKTFSWSDLSAEVLSQVCTCTKRFNNSGWSLDPKTGYWVHKINVPGVPPCDKPSRFSAVSICEGCDKVCVPVVSPHMLAGTMDDILCRDCYNFMHGL